MNKLLTMMVAGTVMMAVVFPTLANGPRHGGSHGGAPYHGNYGGHGGHGGHGDWSTVGQIMTGVLIGGILQSACYAEPVRREVVYAQPVYQPAPVQYVQPQPVVYAPPAYPPAPVQYAQPVVTRQNTSVTLWVQNSNGSQTPVLLRRADNGQYIGPRGECYTGFPTNEHLRRLYGI